MRKYEGTRVRKCDRSRAVALSYLRTLVLSHLLAVLLALPSPAPAQDRAAASLVVTATDDSTDARIAGAWVRVSGVRGPVRTGEDGVARVEGVRPGTHLVSVVQPGYRMQRFSVLVSAGAALEVEVLMEPQVVEVVLEGLTVTSWGRSPVLRRNGYYDRAEGGGPAHFLTRDDIEARRPRTLLDLFRRMQGFRVVPIRGTSGRPRVGNTLVSARSDGITGLRCTPTFFLDGTEMGNTEQAAQDVLQTLPWESVEGIEAYPATAAVPALYGRSASCGVILLWTR